MSCYSCKLTQSRVNKGFLLLTVAEATNSIAYTEYQRHNIVDEENIGRVNLAVDFRGFVARHGLWGCWFFFWAELLIVLFASVCYKRFLKMSILFRL